MAVGLQMVDHPQQGIEMFAEDAVWGGPVRHFAFATGNFPVCKDR